MFVASRRDALLVEKNITRGRASHRDAPLKGSVIKEWRSYGTLHSKKMVCYRPDVPTGHGRLCSMGLIGIETSNVLKSYHWISIESHWF